MPSLPIAERMGRADGSLALVRLVVIIGTESPRSRNAAAALGSSLATRSGGTNPPGRTVRSGPAILSWLSIDATSAKL
jgi:hypothetical protein